MVKDYRVRGRKIYLEYANEVWNGGYQATQYAKERGLALGLSTLDWQAGLRFYSQRSVEMFKIWSQILPRKALVRVMASQAANSGVSSEVLDWKNASASTDALAIAPYFGEVPNTSEAPAALALGVDGNFARINNKILPEVRGFIRVNRQIATAHGVDLIAYEGGQHFVGLGAAQDNQALMNMYFAMNRDPRMKTAYLKYLDIWREEGGHLFVHFTSTERWSKYGSWGVLESDTQPRAQAPKFDAVMTWIERNPRWW